MYLPATAGQASPASAELKQVRYGSKLEGLKGTTQKSDFAYVFL